MPTLTVELPSLHKSQRAIVGDDSRFRVVAAGRRFGKTKLGSLLCFMVATQGKRAWWVAPTYGIASIGWRMVKRLAQQIPGATVRESAMTVELPTGGVVQVKSGDNPDNLRGEGLDFVVMDECAFVKEEAWTEVLRPALADRKGGALFISTPRGRNWFWRLWQRAKESNDPAWKAFHFSSSDNPLIAHSEIEAARLSLPERVFRQEMLAEFLEDGGGVFRGVMACATAGMQTNRHHGHNYIVGVDWAREEDFTVFIVLDLTLMAVVAMERFNQIDYTIQVGRLQGLADRFRPTAIIAESNSIGQPLIEQLRRLGLPVVPFMTTGATKQVIIDALVLAFERRQLTIIPDETLIDELQAYTMERLPSGSVRYGAPPGLHDDCVMALAIAMHGAGNQRKRVTAREY